MIQTAQLTSWRQAWRLAQRELRGGTKGFRIFLACLILGVTTIAAVSSLNQSINGGLTRDGSILLGGDLDLRLSNQPANAEQLGYLSTHGQVSTVTEMRAMARFQEDRSLVELKAVDSFYPLVGQVEMTPQLPIAEALAKNGAVVDKSLMTRLSLSVGDTVKIGQADVVVRAVIKNEPDRVASVINFGPSVILSDTTLAATALLQPGSVVHYHHRVLMDNASAVPALIDSLKERFPDAGWRVRTTDNAAPRIENFIDRLALFLSFVGFTTLLIGGVGVSSGVRDYLNGKIPSIATFKCLGAPSQLIFRTYLLQILALSFLGTIVGLIIGALLPILAATLGGDLFPVRPEVALYPLALLAAGGFGLLTALTFALWPLGRVQSIQASALFRDKAVPASGRVARRYRIMTLFAALGLIALTLLTAHDRLFATVFIVIAAAILGLLHYAGRLSVWVAQRLPHPKRTSLRLALTAIYRPNTTAPAVILSLGLGLSVLVAVGQIDQNLRGQIDENLPKQAPTFFFVDIQNEQAAGFDALIQSFSGSQDYQRRPSLRARITHIDGVEVDKVTIDPDSQWAVRGDRALTYSANLPDDTTLLAGSWWPEDYSGPPLISFDAGLARGFGVGVGDTLSLNILGRPITAEIASLREIDWRSLQFDFAIILSPGLLEYAPHSHIAAVHTPSDQEDSLEKAIATTYPNISVVRVKEALDAARTIMDGISTAIGLAASLTVLAGTLVLAGAMASGRERRTYEAIVFKVLGATRGRMVTAYLLEYGALGLLTGVISAVIGSTAAWGVITFIMDMEWSLYADSILITLAACLVLTITAGFLGTWQALGQKAAPHLRNE